MDIVMREKEKTIPNFLSYFLRFDFDNFKCFIFEMLDYALWWKKIYYFDTVFLVQCLRPSVIFLFSQKLSVLSAFTIWQCQEATAVDMISKPVWNRLFASQFIGDGTGLKCILSWNKMQYLDIFLACGFFFFKYESLF